MRREKNELLNALISASSDNESLSRFLPPSFLNGSKKQNKARRLSFAVLLSAAQWSENIHYSWLYDALKGLSPASQKLFLSILTPQQAEGLAKLLKLSFKPVAVTRFAVPYLMYILKKEAQPESILIAAELPESKLNELLKLTRPELSHAIDLLGIYDLATDLRQIVDKEVLNKIYEALSPSMLHFLHYASKQPVKWVPPKLRIESWDGSAKTLQQLLHQRGLIRLARAIADEDASFQWHLLHRVDIGRAQILTKALKQKQDPSLIPYFKSQVLHIIKRFQK